MRRSESFNSGFGGNWRGNYEGSPRDAFYESVSTSSGSAPTRPAVTLRRDDVTDVLAPGLLPNVSSRQHDPPFLYLILCTLPVLARGVSFVVQVEYIGVLWRHLHATEGFYQGLMVTGPLLALFLAVPIGALSDSCTSRVGRRRPFLWIGIICLFVGLALSRLARFSPLTHDLLDSSEDGRIIAISLAVAGLVILEMSTSFMDAPARAYLVDIAPEPYYVQGNGFFAASENLGNVAIYSLGYFLSQREFEANMDYILYGVMGLVAFIGVALVFLKEEVLVLSKPPAGSTGPTAEKGGGLSKVVCGTKKILVEFFHLPSAMWKIFIIYFFSWLAYFPFLLLISTWWGMSLYGGEMDSKKNDASKVELFHQGEHVCSLGLMIGGSVGVVSGILLQPLTKLFGLANFYLFSQITYTTVVLLLIWLDVGTSGFLSPVEISPTLRDTVGVTFTALCFFALVTLDSYPYVLVARLANSNGRGMEKEEAYHMLPSEEEAPRTGLGTENIGVLFGFLRLFGSIPQCLALLGIGGVLKMAGGSLSAAFGISAAASCMATGLIVLFVPRN